MLQSMHLKRQPKEQVFSRIFLNSILEIKFIKATVHVIRVPAKEFLFKLKLNEEQIGELVTYVNSLSSSELLFGLRFAYSRHTAEKGGYLMPGRKSLVKRETLSLSQDQAKWRLNNWKAMIKTYREKDYSYPTISRIKKQLCKIADQK